MRPCLEPGCHELTNATRCAAHARQHERTRRPPTAQRGYDNAWTRYSKAARTANPICQFPGGCHAPAHSTDHTTGLTLCRRHHPTEANGGVSGLL